MKIYCYFLLNIKHGASQLYWGHPPNTTMRLQGGESGGRDGRRAGASLRPSGGLQLSSAGTAYAAVSDRSTDNRITKGVSLLR